MTKKITALRLWMKEDKIDAFLVPRADMFQGENVAPCDERLEWLTGFDGSAGLGASRFVADAAADAALFFSTLPDVTTFSGSRSIVTGFLADLVWPLRLPDAPPGFLLDLFGFAVMVGKSRSLIVSHQTRWHTLRYVNLSQSPLAIKAFVLVRPLFKAVSAIPVRSA